MRLVSVILAFLISTSALAYDVATIPQINIYQGEDFQQIWQLQTCSSYNMYGACTSDLTPVDLTGCTVSASSKKHPTDVTPFINFSTQIYSNYPGSIRVSLSHNQTVSFTSRQNSYFDMYIRYPDGSIQYLLNSNVMTQPTITR